MSQPKPITTSLSEPVTHLVMDDLAARSAHGKAEYGTELMTNNGRDPLVDAYEESLDQSVYLKQAIMQRGEEQDLIRELTTRINRAEGEAAQLEMWLRQVAAETNDRNNPSGRLVTVAQIADRFRACLEQRDNLPGRAWSTDVQAALEELVACKRLKRAHLATPADTPENCRRAIELKAEHDRRAPAAWERAERLVGRLEGANPEVLNA